MLTEPFGQLSKPVSPDVQWCTKIVPGWWIGKDCQVKLEIRVNPIGIGQGLTLKSPHVSWRLLGRGEKIRTSDLHVPNVAR